MGASACLSIMGSGQSVPKGSPLACVLKNLKPLSHTELKANRLKQLCTQIWPQYQLDNQDCWPEVSTFDFIYLFIYFLSCISDLYQPPQRLLRRNSPHAYITGLL